MTLATTCPVCKTSFKVIPDQLKLRRGLVRCGSCHTVFSGIDHLRHINDELGQSQSGAPPASGASPAYSSGPDVVADPEAGGEPRAESPDTAQFERAIAEFVAESEQDESAESNIVKALERGAETREDQHPGSSERFQEEPAGWPRAEHSDAGQDAVPGEIPAEIYDTPSEEPPAHLPGDAPEQWLAEPPAHAPGALPDDSAEAVTPRAEPAPEDDASAESAHDEQARESDPPGAELAIPAHMQAPQEDAIDFFSESAQRRVRWWPRSAFGKSFALLLLLALAAQLALALRSEIVARFPAAREPLEALAQPLGLQVELPRNPRKITIEIDLSVGDAPGVYRMNALLRSHADTALQWPAIEISLTDSNGATVVRRVLMPRDYLADQAAIVAGLPARQEQNLRVDFQLRDVVLTGYSAVLFYP